MLWSLSWDVHNSKVPILHVLTLIKDTCKQAADKLFFTLLPQPLFSDVTFRVEGTLVHSHKLVLCSRCEVMSAMLTGGFAESQSNEVRFIITLYTWKLLLDRNFASPATLLLQKLKFSKINSSHVVKMTIGSYMYFNYLHGTVCRIKI